VKKEIKGTGGNYLDFFVRAAYVHCHRTICPLLTVFAFFGPSGEQSWIKLHAAHAVRADICDRIEDILVQKSRTYVAIADVCGDFDLF
jgi:hypothetical protein